MTPGTSRMAMRTFVLVCTGQILSVLGSQLTAFGLGVWSYQRTGSTTAYGLMALATLAPGMLAAPLAGLLVDRSARAAMIAGHLGAGACTFTLALLVHLGAAPFGAVLALVALTSVCNAVQFPGLSAVTPRLVPPEHLGRAQGALQLGMATGQVGAPVLAAMLLASLGLWPILALDALSFFFASTLLLVCRLPSVPRPTRAAGALAEAGQGWRYLRAQPGLLGLLGLLALLNFTVGASQVLLTPFVLGFANVQVLGRVMSVGGLGMVLGSVLLLVWGGPRRRRVLALLGFALLEGVAMMALGLLRPSAALVAGCAFAVLFAVPLVTGCAQVLWQLKVPAGLQGRVFGLRVLVAQGAIPLAFLIAGPLADHVFEPLWRTPGRGIALFFMLLGALSVLGVGWAARSSRLRRLERELDDTGRGRPKPGGWTTAQPREA